MDRLQKVYCCVLLIFMLWALWFGCTWSSRGALPDSVEDFSNILNVRNLPGGEEDWNSFCFLDQGSWIGFGLPAEDDPSTWGGFSGPFCLYNGRWLSAELLKVAILLGSDTLFADQADSAKLHFYPGWLEQRLSFAEGTLQMRLFYLSSRQVGWLVEWNPEDGRQPVGWHWMGEVFSTVPIGMVRRGVASVEFVAWNNFHLRLYWPQELQRVSVWQKGHRFRLNIPGGPRKSETFRSWVVIEWAPWGKPLGSGLPAWDFSALEQRFQQERTRWQGYLDRIFSHQSVWLDSLKYRRLAVKCLLTLISNWREAYGDIHHDGLFPSYAIPYFNGFWAWDSWKHAVALAYLDPDLAKDQIRAMFDYQNEQGMVADVIYADSRENNWRNTKPPLAAWAVWRVFQVGRDTAFVREVLPFLLRYHAWWYRNRDHDGDGLCEYGSTDSTFEAARWESGMDNAVRFDHARILRNGEGAYSLNQESVDLNAYLFAEKGYLADLLEGVGDRKRAAILRTEAERLGQDIRQKFFDDTDGYFYDLRIPEHRFVRVQGPEGWIPLWTGAATSEQAERVVRIISDPQKFATYVPFPTIARDHPEFSLRYWRGPVWLDQAYFGIRALERYGYVERAHRLTWDLINHAENLLVPGAPIRENYDPIIGRGMRVNHFSWSAAHLLLLLMGK